MYEREKLDVFHFEMQLIKPLWDVANRGVKVDVAAMQELRSTCEREQKELNAQLAEIAGEAINVKSSQQVGRLLHDKLGVPKGGRTAGGQQKVDDKTLAALDTKCSTQTQRDTIRLIRDERERRDLISKFCDIELEEDGRLRGHYNPAGTDTGRLAGKKFFPTNRGANPQNFPKDKRVRRVFIPDTGKRFGYADLERAESLVVAHLSHDPQMLRNHEPRVDGHKRVGAYLFGLTEEQVDGDIRYMAKRTAHSGNYMMGPVQFQTQVNADSSKTGISITRSEATRLLTLYKEYYDGLPTWWRSIETEVKKTKHLQNVLGRPRQFFDAIARCLPTCVAYKPQSTVGDVLNVGLLNSVGEICPHTRRRDNPDRIRSAASDLARNGFEILLQVHDAIAFQFNEGAEEPVARAVREALTVPLTEPDTGEPFSIPVEIAFGPNWGDVKVYHA